MSPHTPGPWTAVQDGNEVDWYIVDKDESVIVFGLSEADARLSAAAPDLLAVAKDMLTYIEDYAASSDEDDPVHELLPRYRAAIAKAEGEP